MKYNNADALYAAQTVFPEAKNAKKINKGFSHEIFEVETNTSPEKIIIKFSNNSDECYNLKKEVRVHQIFQELGIPVPRVIIHDDAKKKHPFEFIILSKIPGFDLREIWEKLNKNEQEFLAKQMGEILGRIHQVKFDKYGYLTSECIKDKHNFSLKQVSKGIKINPSSLNIVSNGLSDAGMLVVNKKIDNKFIQQICNYLIENQHFAESYEKPSLIHGDYEPINVRVKKIKGQWKIISILDFEFCASMPKEYDFIKLHRFGFLENNHIRKGFLKGYEKYQTLDKNFDEKVRFMRFTRDIGFAGILFKAGNMEYGNKILKGILEEMQRGKLNKSKK